MSRPYSVLLVEDHDSLRHILVELLRDRGWTIYPTDDGHNAMRILRRVQPDFGILDMHLPDSTGLELFQTIAREFGPLPSIMMSGDATPTETAAALQAGVFKFLRKPIAMQHLQRSLDLLIQSHFPTSPGRPPARRSRPSP